MASLKTILRRVFYTAACISAFLLLTTLILWPLPHYRSLAVVNTDSTTYAARINFQVGRSTILIYSSAQLFSGSLTQPSWFFCPNSSRRFPCR
jgi:hypothetical protein